jgi:DNA-binding winged helix-turn-helix (wHTH) protein/TolB-like protein
VTYRFGLFEFDDTAGELRRQGRLVRLEPQPARALALLLSRAGGVVSREEMRAHVWNAGTHVDFDRGLAYCIGQVRTALGDTADNPRFVETLPRRGHRFIAPVERDTPSVHPAASALTFTSDAVRPSVTDVVVGVLEPPPSAVPVGRPPRAWWPVVALTLLVVGAVGWTAWARIAPPRPLVAVAVFDNETGNPNFDPLARTAADIMVERLTGLGPQTVGVIGNMPSLREARSDRDPARVRAETGAGFLVFGQVQPDDVGVRLIVHLIRLDDDTHVWVTRVSRALTDLTDIEQVAADRLAEAVRRHVVERDPHAPRFTR